MKFSFLEILVVQACVWFLFNYWEIEIKDFLALCISGIRARVPESIGRVPKWGNLQQDLWVVGCEKMPPRVAPRGRDRGGGRKPHGIDDFRALQRKFQALQEELHRGVDVRRRDDSEDEVENEEPFKEEEQDIIDPGEIKLLKVILKLGKDQRWKSQNLMEA